MEPHPLHRRWTGTIQGRGVIAAVVVVVIALGAWLIREGHDERPPTVSVRTPPLAAPSPAETPPAPRVAQALQSVVSAHGEDEVELCGGEWIEVGADGTAAERDVRALGQRVLQNTLAPTIALLLGSADERTRAAGHVLQAANVDLLVPGCHEDKTCLDGERQKHRAALVYLARFTADAQLYAWAYQSCLGAKPDDPTGCQQISIEQWARLDPGNATPWMHAAWAAKQRGDASALDEALYRVASAERQDAGWGKLAATIVDHVPVGEAHLLGAETLLVQAIGVDAAATVPYGPLMDYCSVRALADANRHETCSRIAAVLGQHSMTMLDRGMGTALGKRLGWPADRIHAAEEEGEAIGGVYRTASWSRGLPVSCKAIVAATDWIRDVAAEGEIGAARKVIAASGRSVAALAAEARAANAALIRLASASAAASEAEIASGARAPLR